LAARLIAAGDRWHGLLRFGESIYFFQGASME
jgi:hypothetical protein